MLFINTIKNLLKKSHVQNNRNFYRKNLGLLGKFSKNVIFSTTTL